MLIPIFAILYRHWIRLHEWITSSEMWRWIRGQIERLKLVFRRAMPSIKARWLLDALPTPHARASRMRRG
jgi:hypothetical protein